MSKYETIQTLQKEIELFPHAKFFSLNEEDSVIVKNEKTGAMFSVPYAEESEGKFIFRGGSAEQVKQADISEMEVFVDNSKKLREGIKGIFSENMEQAIEYIREAIHELPQVDPSTFVEAETKEDEVYEGILADKVNEYNAIEKEFQSQLVMFDEDGQIIDKDISLSHYGQLYEEAREEFGHFIKAIRSYSEFKNALMERIDDEKVVDKVLESVNLEDKIEITVPKALVIAKNTINEDLNVIETTKEVIGLWKETFNEDGLSPAQAAPFVFNHAQKDSERPKFLKFKMGLFTVEDVMVLLEELDHAMSHIGDINEDELMFIANQKMICEYMLRTRKISDRMVKKIVEEFNSKFTQKVREDDYEHSALGFKDIEDKDMGNVQGKADITPE